MRMRSGLIAAILLASVGLAHTETKTKPQIAISTKTAEITVTVDPALRQHPGLFEDTLAEGRRWAARYSAEAAKTAREEPEFFSKGRRWTFERDYTLRSVVGRYVSVVRDDGTYTGGAHPNTLLDTILWDREARRRMSIRPFFRETADNGPTMTALAQLTKIAVAIEKLFRDTINVDVPKEQLTPQRLAELDRFIADGVQPSLLKIGPISLAPSTEPGKSAGLTFHYSPYAVGAYAEGPYIVFVPWTEFRTHLSAQGAAIFGGQRPTSDVNP
jgi:hypothetical protein